MPTIILEDVPTDVYERLQQRAAHQQRSLREELLLLLRQALQGKDGLAPWLAEYVPGEEIPTPCDLPLPESAMLVKAIPGEPPLPDPIEMAPE